MGSGDARCVATTVAATLPEPGPAVTSAVSCVMPPAPGVAHLVLVVSVSTVRTSPALGITCLALYCQRCAPSPRHTDDSAVGYDHPIGQAGRRAYRARLCHWASR